MRLRSFNAPTMAEAMRLVRDELGDDAVIVSTHHSRRGRGVQLTAAVERREVEFEPVQELPPVAEDGEIAQALSYHGVPARLAERLVRAAVDSGHAEAELALATALDDYLEFASGQLPPSDGALMLVGPPGAGKTTTAAKLAARAALGGGELAICTTDVVRAGAVTQLEAYAEVLQQPLLTAEEPKHLSIMLQEFGTGHRPLLVDTAGSNPHDPDDLEILRDFVKAGSVEPVLVLPAGGDAEEMADAALAFARIGCRRLIVTRLDAARRYGGLIGAAAAGKLALAAVGCSASIPHGLKDLTPLALARVLLRDPRQPLLVPGADTDER